MAKTKAQRRAEKLQRRQLSMINKLEKRGYLSIDDVIFEGTMVVPQIKTPTPKVKSTPIKRSKLPTGVVNKALKYANKGFNYSTVNSFKSAPKSVSSFTPSADDIYEIVSKEPSKIDTIVEKEYKDEYREPNPQTNIGKLKLKFEDAEYSQYKIDRNSEEANKVENLRRLFNGSWVFTKKGDRDILNELYGDVYDRLTDNLDKLSTLSGDEFDEIYNDTMAIMNNILFVRDSMTLSNPRKVRKERDMFGRIKKDKSDTPIQDQHITDTPADVSIIDDIMSRLERLQRGEDTRKFNIEGRKQGLIGIFEETLINNADDLEPLANYLMEHREEIFNALEVIEYDSDEGNVEASFARVGKILNQGALNPFQAEQISEQAEYFVNY